jgi:glucose/mannose-6-phosphate isomerase
MELNDLLKIDTKQMFKTYDDWPNIARESFEEKFKKIDIKDIDHIVFAGMGGSGSIGDTIEAILSKKNIHVSLSKGYILPKTVDSKTLVIATSVSGNTAEILEIVKNVKKTDATAVGFSSGGKLEDLCRENEIMYQKISMIHSPRSSFTKFLFSILNILEPILPIKQNEVLDAISSLEQTKQKIFSENLTENISLELAKFVTDPVCIYYPAGLRASATRYKNSLQENSKIHAMIEDVIESCHNGIVAWEEKSNVKPIMIQGLDDNYRTIERWRILEEFFEMKDIEYKVIKSIEGNILSKITNLVYVLDYSTIYTSVLRNIDPSPVNSIDFIKSRL